MKQNGKMNKVVSKLINELKDETLLRRSKKKRDEKLEKVESELCRARVLIRDAGTNHSRTFSGVDDSDYVPDGSIYRNPNMFHRYFISISIPNLVLCDIRVVGGSRFYVRNPVYMHIKRLF